MGNPYPSIPAPDSTVDGLYRTVLSMKRAVELLVLNAGPSSSTPLSSGANIFAKPNVVDSVSKEVAQVKASTTKQFATQGEQIAQLAHSVATLSDAIAAIAAKYGLVGTVAGSDFTFTGISSLGTSDNKRLILDDHALINGLLLRTGSISQVASHKDNLGTITLDFAARDGSSVILLGHYWGAGAVTAGETATLVLATDTTDHVSVPVQIAGTASYSQIAFWSGVPGVTAHASCRLVQTNGTPAMTGLELLAIELTR